MTITMRAPLTPSAAAVENGEADVVWRAMRDGAWAARRDGRHLGTVERGRRWIATDSDSELIGAYRTFREAQAAVAAPAAQRAPSPRSAAPRLMAALLVAAATASAVAGLLGAGLLH
jgi:hypothetical protein